MLKGYIVYNDEKLGKVRFDVVARDSFNDLKMQLRMNSGSNQVGREFTAVEYVEEKEKDIYYEHFFDLLEDGSINKEYTTISEMDKCVRRLDVKKTNKYKSNITNKDFAVKLSALIRYMQIAGKKQFSVQSNEEFSAVRDVEIIEIATQQKIGYISYNMGLITKLVCQNKYFEVSLHTVDDKEIEKDRSFGESIFKELKEKDKFGRRLSATPISIVGFKLSDELLGFPYIPEVVKEIPQVFGMYQTIEDVIQANPDKNTAWILDQEYHIVTDETLEDVIKMFNEHDGMIAYDTETSGLNINFKSRTNEADQLVGVVLSRKSGEGYYFPLQHKLFPNLCGGDHFYFMDRYMRPILENKQIICHNLKFDWKVAYIYDINVNCVYDTMLAFGVTKRYEEETYALGLKDLTKNILGRDSFELSDFVMGGSFGDSEIAFWDLPYELVRQYAPADTDNTYALYEFLEKEDMLNKYNAKKVFEMEITFAKAVAYSEFYGYHIDVEHIPELNNKIVGEMERCKKEMFAIAGEEFNPNSPAQLVNIMYDKLNVEQVGEKRSTDKETLKTLASRTNPDGSPKYPFVKLLKTYRDNESIYKNFLKRLPEFATTDGYIFPDVLQIGTNTGRVSVKNPNYQGYNDIVKHYVVPRQDYMHFDSDFAQIEQRVLVSYASIMFNDYESLALLKDFDDPDMDYHQYQAARMFNVPYASVTKAMRQQSKGINFGLPYGMGDSSLGARIFGERTPENTKKAEKLRQKFFQGQELIQEFFEEVRNTGVEKGYTETQWGRRRYYHKGVFSVAEIRRQAGNHAIQGTAADLYKKAVNNMFERICKEGWLGKVLINGFIHDEMLMEVHKSINPYYFFKVWRDEFEVRPEHYCKLYAGAGVGKCWYDAKKLDLHPLYIQEIIDTYKEGMPWNEDIEEFLNAVKVGFKDHKLKRVKDYMVDETVQGEVIKPAISALLGDEIENILPNIISDSEKIKEYNEILEENTIDESTGKIKGLQDQIKLFCKYYDIDYSNVNIKSPDDVPVQSSNSGNGYEVEDEIDLDDLGGVDTAELFKLSLMSNGIAIDFENATIHMAELFIKAPNNQKIQATAKFIQESAIIKGDKGYKIIYYPNLKGENPQSVEIEGFRVPFENASFIMRYYSDMLARQFAYVIR